MYSKDFFFNGNSNPEILGSIKSYLTNKIKSFEDFEDPSEEFLIDISDMIFAKKTMHEIFIELEEFLDTEKNNELIEGLQATIERFEQQKQQSLDISANENASTTLLGALKTSREKATPAKSSLSNIETDGTARKLNTALNSTRFQSPSETTQNDHNQRHERNNNTKYDRTNRKINNFQGNNSQNPRQFNKNNADGNEQKFNKRQFNSENSSDQNPSFNKKAKAQETQPSAEASAIEDSISYFEKMNKIAVESGFKNAQEMLASQREFMSIMSSSMTPMMTPYGLPPYPAYPPPVPYPLGPPPQFSNKPYPYQSKSFNSKPFPNKTLKLNSHKDNAEQQPSDDKGQQSDSQTQPNETQVSNDQQAPQHFPQGNTRISSGRESFRGGRGRGGRFQNKTYIAPTANIPPTEPGRFQNKTYIAPTANIPPTEPSQPPLQPNPIPSNNFVNPFSAQSNAASVQSFFPAAQIVDQSQTIQSTLTHSMPSDFHSGGGRGGRGRGRAGRAIHGNKVWVRSDLQPTQKPLENPTPAEI